MAQYDSMELIGIDDFTVEVTGSLVGSLIGIDLGTSFIATLVTAIVKLSSEPIKKIVIHTAQTYADIEVDYYIIRKKTRIRKIEGLAKIYNEAIHRASTNTSYNGAQRTQLMDIFKEDLNLQLAELRLA